jgi:hypothetical protein
MKIPAPAFSGAGPTAGGRAPRPSFHPFAAPANCLRAGARRVKITKSWAVCKDIP